MLDKISDHPKVIQLILIGPTDKMHHALTELTDQRLEEIIDKIVVELFHHKPRRKRLAVVHSLEEAQDTINKIEG